LRPFLLVRDGRFLWMLALRLVGPAASLRLAKKRAAPP
jgi:hypothetical protein